MQMRKMNVPHTCARVHTPYIRTNNALTHTHTHIHKRAHTQTHTHTLSLTHKHIQLPAATGELGVEQGRLNARPKLSCSRAVCNAIESFLRVFLVSSYRQSCPPRTHANCIHTIIQTHTCTRIHAYTHSHTRQPHPHEACAHTSTCTCAHTCSDHMLLHIQAINLLIVFLFLTQRIRYSGTLSRTCL